MAEHAKMTSIEPQQRRRLIEPNFRKENPCPRFL
jgi:hypothetical protein